MIFQNKNSRCCVFEPAFGLFFSASKESFFLQVLLGSLCFPTIFPTGRDIPRKKSRGHRFIPQGWDRAPGEPVEVVSELGAVLHRFAKVKKPEDAGVVGLGAGWEAGLHGFPKNMILIVDISGWLVDAGV